MQTIPSVNIAHSYHYSHLLGAKHVMDYFAKIIQAHHHHTQNEHVGRNIVMFYISRTTSTVFGLPYVSNLLEAQPSAEMLHTIPLPTAH